MNKKNILNSLLILSFIALSFAYFIQYTRSRTLAVLCKIERIHTSEL